MEADVTTSTVTTYICPDGYVCMGGAIHESLNNDVNVRLCAVGWFCNLSVSGVPESPCPINYYNKSKGQTSCLPCPQGFVCDKIGTVDPIPCKVGHYCPTYDPTNPTIISSGVLSGTVATSMIPCPAGSFNPNQYAYHVGQCWPCTPGKYCVKGSDAPTGICNEGYVCSSSSGVANPNSAMIASNTTPFTGTSYDAS